MFNKVILVGRMTADPEIKTTPKGTSTCSFSVACDRQFKDKDGNRKSDFIPCVAWRSLAEFIVKYFQKGSPIGIEGSLETRTYTDKNGNKRTAYEVNADRAFFVGGKEKNAVEVESPAQAEIAPEEYDPNGDSDLPF